MLNKLRVMWNVILGRPTIYGVCLMNGLDLSSGNERILICDCEFQRGKATEEGQRIGDLVFADRMFG